MGKKQDLGSEKKVVRNGSKSTKNPDEVKELDTALKYSMWSYEERTEVAVELSLLCRLY